MPVTLEDGCSYRTRNGSEETIGGTTKVNPDWVWSIAGNWFERATGHYVSYRLRNWAKPDDGGRYVVQPESSSTLVALAGIGKEQS